MNNNKETTPDSKEMFTGGDWFVINGWDKNGKGRYFPSVVFDKKHTIPKDGEDHIGTLHIPSITVNVSHDRQKKSLMANANLISAAPDMYRALKMVKEYFESKYQGKEGSDYLNISQVEAAIKKALGNK